jgi:hypothetical protein
MVVDFRKVNKKIKFDSYPMPTIDEAFQQCTERYFNMFVVVIYVNEPRPLKILELGYIRQRLLLVRWKKSSSILWDFMGYQASLVILDRFSKSVVFYPVKSYHVKGGLRSIRMVLLSGLRSSRGCGI